MSYTVASFLVNLWSFAIGELWSDILRHSSFVFEQIFTTDTVMDSELNCLLVYNGVGGGVGMT